MVKLNGELLPLDGKKLTDYLNEHHFSVNLIAVEVNGNILPKSDYFSYIFRDGDSVEIVGFVGGG